MQMDEYTAIMNEANQAINKAARHRFILSVLYLRVFKPENCAGIVGDKLNQQGIR
jgi:hypothetical protein